MLNNTYTQKKLKRGFEHPALTLFDQLTHPSISRERLIGFLGGVILTAIILYLGLELYRLSLQPFSNILELPL